MFPKFLRNFCFVIIFVLAVSSNVSARLILDYPTRQIIVGRVYKMDADRLYMIEDHTEEKLDFFIHPNASKDFKPGDRVRVYFKSALLPPTKIKKLKPVPYIKEKQNAGYLLREEKKTEIMPPK